MLSDTCVFGLSILDCTFAYSNVYINRVDCYYNKEAVMFRRSMQDNDLSEISSKQGATKFNYLTTIRK